MVEPYTSLLYYPAIVKPWVVPTEFTVHKPQFVYCNSVLLPDIYHSFTVLLPDIYHSLFMVQVDVVSASKNVADHFQSVADEDLLTQSLNAIINRLGRSWYTLFYADDFVNIF